MAVKKEQILTPFKVGALVTGAFVAFFAFLQVVSTRSLSRSDSYDVVAYFDDVLGLEEESPVQIAGIDIGRIRTIELVKGRAKVTMEIDGQIELYEDASIEKVAISLLGDYKLSVEPGREGRRLEDGDEIKNVISLSSVDAVVAEVREMSSAMRKLIAGEDGEPSPLEMIVKDVQGTAAATRAIMEEVGGNIGDNTEKLNKILANIELFTKDLSNISAGKERDIAAILRDTRAIAASIRVTSESVERMIGGRSQSDIDESVQSLKQSLDTMNRSLERLASITKKIDDGEGTVGALINDKSVHEGIKEAVDGVNSVVGSIGRLQTWVNLRSEYFMRAGALKNYVHFRLQPSEDSAYIFEVVDDPRGVRETTIVDVETTSPELGRASQYRERRTITIDGLNFSLQFQKRFYWLSMRFGIIEGTGGVGLNLHFFDDDLEFLFDVNRFGEDQRLPRLKALALWEPIPHVYLHGGLDDPFNRGTVDYFLGLGVRFNDRDLKSLLALTGGFGVSGGGSGGGN